MTQDGFTPRIVVPDEQDMQTVSAALVDYTVGIYTRARQHGGHGLMETVREALRASELLLALGEAVEAEEFRKEFGTVPDDISTMGDGIGE